MIYSPLVQKAARIAFLFHEHQSDQGGYPYVCHSLHVAEQMDDETSTVVAILHDVVEDTSCSLEYLAGIFPQPIIEAIDAITRRDGENYLEYIRRVAKNEIAKKVKIVDIIHNLDESRLPNGKMENSLKNRYEVALGILSVPNP